MTDPEGKFVIQGLPAGTFTLKLWHETLGTQERQVKIKAGEATDLGDILLKKN